MKLRISDRRQLLRQLKRLKAKLTHARVREMNTLYDTDDGQLARRGQMLRLRVESAARGGPRAGQRRRVAKDRPRPTNSAVLTFKGPVDGAETNNREQYKIRAEHELRVSNPEEMPKIFEALGLRPWFRYEKFRSTFSLPGMTHLKLTLDETPIGLFVELEGERGEIDRAAGMLGFARSDYINTSYGALFMEERGMAGPGSGREPIPSSGLTDMLFHPDFAARRVSTKDSARPCTLQRRDGRSAFYVAAVANYSQRSPTRNGPRARLPRLVH